jgi:formate hydrogenlyase subunit 3/multisubunit Na+/H+ antiporter MnhD subunit
MMEKALVEIFNLVAIAAIVSIPFLNTKGRGRLTLAIITLQVTIISLLAFSVFAGGSAEFFYPGSWVTGVIPIRIDYLSAWFILVISFTFLTGVWYGVQYMNKYMEQPDNLALHAAAFILLFTSLVDICLIQNSLVILVVWEIMALSSFVLVIFEHYKSATLKAGINFLIQSHVCILFLTVAFMWVKVKTGSFDFNAITLFSTSQATIASLALFIFFFTGFAIKAGFVPFHTWLPLAHPAAPAHISGIMSGVIIKIGIYGIFRVLMLIQSDRVTIGYFILLVSVITGLYGVMLAIVQHNLKKLLAYHSIENIGIIGIGIGLGCLGLGYGNPQLVFAGFGGALLHVLNHSLFKSLLFFSAGNVYQARHTMNIESLGGLIKKMPHSGYLFLIGSLAICGLPPFNGFISEFFLYNGLFHGLSTGNFVFILVILFTILGLVIIGGLALICFTKAFGIVFLGTSREDSARESTLEKPLRIWPMYGIVLFIIVIGLFPILFSNPLIQIVSQYLPEMNPRVQLLSGEIFGKLTIVGWFSLAFLALILVIYYLRHLIIRSRVASHQATWGCAYPCATPKMQYTASSFIRTYRKLAEPILSIKREKTEPKGLYPQHIMQRTHPHDKIEVWLIDRPLHFIRKILNSFVFLQNGNIQAYILYGFVFVTLALLLPSLIEKIVVVIKFLNQL